MGIKKRLSSFKSWLGFGKKSKNSVSATKADGLLSPGGMSVFVSVGGEESERMDYFDNTTFELEELPGRALFFKKCGHHGSQGFKFNFYGTENEAELPSELIKEENGQAIVENFTCPECFKKSIIRCCLCGCAILPGEGVALYHKDSEGIHKDVATFVGDSAIGCLSWNCCPSGGFFAGHWTSDGFKPAFPGGKTAVEEVMCTGKPIIKDCE